MLDQRVARSSLGEHACPSLRESAVVDETRPGQRRERIRSFGLVDPVGFEVVLDLARAALAVP